ncbi:MAG: glutaminyl-peptide cyclotransferase [Candidatus Bathyarchaeota archaeon]|nr:glutaminyl-peptide cyclotransferase [Candidatus Bathyarchaeota archaeon]
MMNNQRNTARKSSTRHVIISLLGITVFLILSLYYYNSNYVEYQVTPTQTSQDVSVSLCKIINTYPHDRNAFTQGLVFEKNHLYEGTGLYGRSSLRKIQLENGVILQIRNLSDQYFGEGITIYQDKIIQLTWKNKVGFVYDKDNFQKIQEFHYLTDGWGLTYDGEHLILSDGTSTLHLIDPETYEEVNQIQVFSKEGPVKDLNELEYVKGEIYANVWQTNLIARISPTTGKVTGWIDLSELRRIENSSNPAAIPNGIAYDPKSDRLFVTGKLWSKIFEIELVQIDQKLK